MRVVWKKNRKVAGRKRHPAFRAVAEEHDVFRGIERPGGLRAVAERFPSNLLGPFNCQLDVDVASMCFEACSVVSPAIGASDRHIQAIAVDVVAFGTRRS